MTLPIRTRGFTTNHMLRVRALLKLHVTIAETNRFTFYSDRAAPPSRLSGLYSTFFAATRTSAQQIA